MLAYEVSAYRGRCTVSQLRLHENDTARKMTIEFKPRATLRDTPVRIYALPSDTVAQIEAAYCDAANMPAAVGIHRLKMPNGTVLPCAASLNECLNFWDPGATLTLTPCSEVAHQASVTHGKINFLVDHTVAAQDPVYSASRHS
jgi:hypothetical protein